ncbi:hypothetical protein DY000_02022715 [Brassica cretica]|uniref:SWIM-type domain-containing protein n=1 Tax=Brassica cretica TaxID=69181 RepID=A0ABQ7E8K5_BRACR|nr:hypothetical protein DY000_02022715 [Brassica cretica]
MGMTSLYPNFFYLVFSAESLLHSIPGDLVFLEKIIVSSDLSSLTSFLSSSSSFSHTEQRNRSVLPKGVSSDGSVHYEIEVFFLQFHLNLMFLHTRSERFRKNQAATLNQHKSSHLGWFVNDDEAVDPPTTECTEGHHRVGADDEFVYPGKCTPSKQNRLIEDSEDFIDPPVTQCTQVQGGESFMRGIQVSKMYGYNDVDPVFDEMRGSSFEPVEDDDEAVDPPIAECTDGHDGVGADDEFVDPRRFTPPKQNRVIEDSEEFVDPPGTQSTQVQGGESFMRVLPTGLLVLPCSTWEIEVTHSPTGFGFTVDLEKQTCTCLEFQMLGLPCRHAIAAASSQNMDYSLFFSEYHVKQTWAETIKGIILPIPDPIDVFVPAEILKAELYPPMTKRTKGRSCIKRKFSAGEFPGLAHWVHCKLLRNLLTVASVGLILKTLFRKHIPSFVLVTYRYLLIMPEFPILSLPAEVQALGVQRVAHNSFSDLYRLRSTCKSRCVLADDGGVYAAFDLFKYPWYVGKRNLLLRRCFEEGNPSTLYVKGVEYFYRLDHHIEGLALIKRPADAGFEQASYTYAMTRKIFSDDGEYLSRFTREYVAKIGMVVKSSEGIWHRDHNDAFLTKRHMFISTVVLLFSSFPCCPILQNDWVLWHIEHNKGEDMCNRCFWKK